MITFSRTSLGSKARMAYCLVFIATLFITQSCSDTNQVTPSAAASSVAIPSSGVIVRPIIPIYLAGFQGFVYTAANFVAIPNAVITFSKSDEAYVRVVKADAYGYYKVTLKAGTYYTSVTVAGYDSYSSAPGYFVVTGTDGYETGNFFLSPSVAPSGYEGVVLDGNTKIAGALITFTKSDNAALTYSTYSESNSFYQITLPQGGYYVTASASGYQPYSSSPGIFVLNGSGFFTGNIFLTQ